MDSLTTGNYLSTNNAEISWIIIPLEAKDYCKLECLI